MDSFGIQDLQFALGPVENTSVPIEAKRRSAIRNQFERALTAVEVVADWITVVLALNCGYLIYHLLHIGRHLYYSRSTLTYISFGVAALVVLLLDRDGAYRSGNSLLRIKETERSLRVSVQAFLLVLPVTFFSTYPTSRWVFLFGMLSVPLLQTVQKQLMLVGVRALRARGMGVRRVLIYGAGSSGRKVFSALVRSPKLGLDPVIAVDDDTNLDEQQLYEYAYRRGHSIRVVAGPVTEDLIRRHGCELLIIAIPNLKAEKFSMAMQAANAAGAQLAFVPGHAVVPEHWTEQADIDGIMLSVVGRMAKNWQYDLAKRAFDLIGAVFLILLLAPLWLPICLLVPLDSQGPLLFRQRRVGRNGRLFTLFKFRSMYCEAPKYGLSPTDPKDPRITKIGRALRRTSLDELPQLINVLRGDMSLVGPRPEMPFIANQYNALHRQRLEVLPGITGLWQLSADRAFLIHDNIQYDLYYIRHRSFFMDFAILLHTVVFAMNGV